MTLRQGDDPRLTRAALGVPGMNYSTLLRRSVDFNDFAVT